MALVLMGDFTFKVDYDKKEAALTHYDGTDSFVKIPATVNECKVISIYQSVFENNQYIQHVVLPDTLQFVGARAFKGSSIVELSLEEAGLNTADVCTFYNSVFMDCKKLQKVYFGKIVHFGDWNIFANCVSLKSINLDRAMYNIPKYSFLNCTALKNISTKYPVNIEEKAFWGCNLSSYDEYDVNSTYAEDFADVIHNAIIHCYETSSLSHLTYFGENIAFMN